MEIILPSIVWEVVPLKNNRFVLECYEVTGQTARTSGRVQVSSKPIETQSAASGRSASAFNMRDKKNEKEQQRALLAYLQGLQGHKDERKKEEAMRKRLRKRLAMKAKLAK